MCTPLRARSFAHHLALLEHAAAQKCHRIVIVAHGHYFDRDHGHVAGFIDELVAGR
jgi:hypothetical protein